MSTCPALAAANAASPPKNKNVNFLKNGLSPDEMKIEKS